MNLSRPQAVLFVVSVNTTKADCLMLPYVKVLEESCSLMRIGEGSSRIFLKGLTGLFCGGELAKCDKHLR